ncbi:hypothetical protein EV359DRAFT_85007 [Lentinula novae-zelandiae]|nr:hypothetical protein EV359DRAFT_85007 [Lentinula novae-zelandiae]
MIEDDIQFLGFSTPRPRPSVQAVTGFDLHIEKNGAESGHCMMFRRVNTNTVVVGRKQPQHGSDICDSDSSSAMFRCPVVSRAHAKFTFSESGLLYVTDTSSHHGTHIRRPTDLTSRPIPTETLVQVHNGDVVVFGKSVGRNNEVVRPIVARVELIFNNSISRRPASITKSISSSSGRYGLRSSDTSEGDSSSSDSSANSNESPSPFYDHSSDHESDIVEIPPPPKLSLSTVIPSVNSALRTLTLPILNVPSTEANRDHLSLPSLSFSPSMSNSKFKTPQADKTTIEAVNGVDAYTNDIFDFGSPIHPLEDSFAIRPQTTQALRIRTRISMNTLFQHGRPDGPLRRKSKSWSMSPMDLATPSPPPSPPKIVGNNSLTSTDTPLVISEPKRDSSYKAHHESWSPLSTPPPLPSSPPMRSLQHFSSPPALLNRTGNSGQPSSQSTCAVTCSPEEPILRPPSLLMRMVDSVQTLSHPASTCSKEQESSVAVFVEEAPEHGLSLSSPQSDHIEDVHDVQDSRDPEDNTDMLVSIEDELGPHAEGSRSEERPSVVTDNTEDEDRLGMDEQVFDEVDINRPGVQGEPKNVMTTSLFGVVDTDEITQVEEPNSSMIDLQVMGATSSPVTSVLQRAGAAFSSLKERFSGSNIEIILKEPIDGAHASTVGLTSEAYEADSQEDINKIDKELLSVKNDLATIRLQHCKYRTRFNDNVATMNTKLAQLNILSSSLSTTKDHLSGLDSNLATIQTDIDWVKGDLDGIRSDVDEARGNVDQVRIDTDGNRMEIDGLRNDVESIRGEFDSLRGEVDGVKDECDIVHGDSAGFRNEISEVRSDVEGMRMELNDIRRDIDDLMGQQSLKGDAAVHSEEELSNLRQEWIKWKEDAKVDAQITQARTQSAIDAAHTRGDNLPITELQNCRAGLAIAEADIRALYLQIGDANNLLDTQEEMLKVLQRQDISENTPLRVMIDELLKLQEKSVAGLKATESARSEAENELRIIVALRQEIEHTAAQTISQNYSVRSSLKRKHADDSDDSIGEGSVINVGSFANNSVRACGTIGDDFTTSTVSSDADGILIPSPKRVRRLERTRRIGTVAVQTATVAAVGAIAAWAALAFS